MPIKHVSGGTRMEISGWTCISIRGKPYQRGVAHGSLIAADLRKVKKTIEFIVLNDYGVELDFFIRAGRKYIRPTIERDFPELFEEMRGIADGAKLSLDFIIAWNNYFTLTENWWSKLPPEEAAEVYGTTTGATTHGAIGEGGGTCLHSQ